MANSDPVFIHPLLGPDNAWSGYRVELAPGGVNPEVLAQLCASPLLDEYDNRHPWLLPATACPAEASLPAERIVTVFANGARDSDAAAQYESLLRRARRKVALLASTGGELPASGAWDYLLIGVSHARSLPPYSLIGLASRTALVATDVNTYNDRDWMLGNACALSTGEFLLTRHGTSPHVDITRLKLLKLLTLIDADADTAALETVFREEPKLSYSLLRLVNSAAIAPRSPIASFSQAINLLGRRQLQRWLQLLVYSDPNNGQHPNPLLLKAAARGSLLEALARKLAPEWTSDQACDTAFMIGTFSLLDVLLNLPMQAILGQLPLPEVAQKALGANEGLLGRLLGAIDAAERRDLKTASARFRGLGVDSHDHLLAQLATFAWAAKIRLAD